MPKHARHQTLRGMELKRTIQSQRQVDAQLPAKPFLEFPIKESLQQPYQNFSKTRELFDILCKHIIVTCLSLSAKSQNRGADLAANLRFFIHAPSDGWQFFAVPSVGRMEQETKGDFCG
ncbi:MAG: hypothetical protein FWG12_03470 [Holophagaceae bacterium]|nr:hypothetical protein [Holophagaceae bacterium]